MKKALLIMATSLLSMTLILGHASQPMVFVSAQENQTSISRMDGLSRNPTNYNYVNWRQTTQRYIDFLFNFSNTVNTVSG
ncbi:MAG: hypothetical protein NTV44_01185, partial [Firmicutes bacterium]|nr:hypothetical protein [Bacillota bacterium]